MTEAVGASSNAAATHVLSPMIFMVYFVWWSGLWDELVFAVVADADVAAVVVVVDMALVETVRFC